MSPWSRSTALILPGAPPQALCEPRRREPTLERLTAKSLLERSSDRPGAVDDAAELALIGETKIEAVRELDRQAFEAKWRLLMGDRAQAGRSSAGGRRWRCHRRGR